MNNLSSISGGLTNEQQTSIDYLEVGAAALIVSGVAVGAIQAVCHSGAMQTVATGVTLGLSSKLLAQYYANYQSTSLIQTSDNASS
jgi:hypothetical protein